VADAAASGVSAPSRTCISVVLPVYDEEGTIERCLRGLWGALRDQEHEILVCYDYDEDTTLGAIARMADAPPTVRLVRNQLGRGAANALRAGFAAARGDVVVTTMADLSDPPQVIGELAAKLRREGAAVVSGSRYMPGGSQQGGPWLKSRLSRSACLSLRWVAGVGTHDATNNFRAYSRAFLERTQVESRKAFDIALELTVKAHLAGERVSEVPSSWVDRSAGQSRFQLWRWMPSYLRWYRRAMAAPALVWGVLAALFLWSWLRTGWSPTSAGAERVLACAQTSIAVAAILAARRLRGRMRVPDSLHALLWLPPWLGELARSGLALAWLGVAAAGSAALLAWAGGIARFRGALRASARSVAQRLDQRAALLAVLFALLWLAQFRLPETPDSVDLDPSWIRAYSWFFLSGAQAGVDYIFTYGPLGGLQNGAYATGLFWTQVAVWEIVVKGALAAALVLGVARLRGPLEALVAGLLLLVLPFEIDAYVTLALFAATALQLERGRDRLLPLVATLALLATLSLVKFTYFAVAAACVAALAAAATRRSLHAGATVLGIHALALAAVWLLAGQALLNLPRYLAGAVEIASGYNRAMSLPASGERLLLAGITMALIAVLAAVHALARPWTVRRAAAAALLLAVTFLAFKSAFVRHGGSVTYFGFAALAPFLLVRPPLGGTRAREATTSVLRLACAVVALLGIEGIRDRPRQSALAMSAAAISKVGASWDRLLELPAREREAEASLERQREAFAMPRTRAAVGDATIDLVANEVGLLILNQLDWQPRPVFQSYSAYTPKLQELNARALSSARAPEFVLMGGRSIDVRLPTLDDAALLQVLLRDYEAVLEEKEYLLLRRSPDAGAPAPERPVLFDGQVALGDPIDLRGLQGDCLLLEVEMPLTPKGRLLSFLYQAPRAAIEIVLVDGARYRFRLVPEMTAGGAILYPVLGKHEDWVRWYAGEALPRATWMRLVAEEGCESLYADTAHVRILRADDLAPPGDSQVRVRLLGGTFDPIPAAIESPGGVYRELADDQPVLVVHPPGEVRFELQPGSYAMTGSYGFVRRAYERGKTDGASFRIVLRPQSGGERTLFHEDLDPMHVEEHRGTHPFQLKVESGEPATLVLLTGPGPARDFTRDWCFWGRVQLRDLPQSAQD